ncbi:hypothetical protein FH957_001438, partial [Enterococcus faecium]|nr:hypothetical protein [Enterococcus faecium]
SYRNIERNTHYIREDILVYIEQIDKLIYFKKNEHREYEFNQIIFIMDFYYFLAKYSHSKDSVYFSLSKDEFDNAHTLYRKSEENKQKFNTVQIKKDKQKAQS